MKYRLNSFNSLTATLFHSSFVRKSVFYSKIIQYAYNYYGIELYVNVCRGALEPSRTSMVELLCNNHKKGLL